MDQVCRDRFDAAICVGTSAIYRRTAIMSVGGTPKVWGTEDVRTGLAITRGGVQGQIYPTNCKYWDKPRHITGLFSSA